MQALVFHGPDTMSVEARPDPEVGPGDVLIRVTATGICGSDIHGFTGHTGRRFPGQVMGHETVGRVVAWGSAANQSGRLAVDQVVTVNPVLACGTCEECRADRQHHCPTRRIIGVDPSLSSAFAELLVMPEANVVPLPEGMPEEHGALVEPLTVGYHAARRGGCGPGDRVLVIGGGPIGQAGLLAAERLGADSVVVSEPNPLRRGLLADLGAIAIDPGAGPLADAASEALGGRPSLVLDAVGNSSSIGDALSVSRIGARVVLVGMHEPRLEIPAYSVSTEERTLVGSYCYSAGEFAETAQWASTVPDRLARLIEGRVDWSGTVTSFESLAAGRNPASKVLVFPNGLLSSAH